MLGVAPSEAGLRLPVISRSRVAVDRAPEPRNRRAVIARTAAVVAEISVAFLFATVLLLASRSIDVNPVARLGQVSGLAGIGLRFLVLGVMVLGAVLFALRWREGRAFPLVTRLACAAVAGLATGFVAGGVLVALHGSAWPLNGPAGDAGQLLRWAGHLKFGLAVPDSYPPLPARLIRLVADMTGSGDLAALRALQIFGAALFGPFVYLAWRLVLSAPWALTVGLGAALTLQDPYKPYGALVLGVLVPVLLALLRTLRRSAGLSWAGIATRGVLFGAGLGLLFVTYSGWFVWSAAGVVLAAAVVFPWRAGPLRGLLLLATASAVFLGLAGPHLLGLLAGSGTIRDEYFYFDVNVDPSYIAMWRTDLPGNPGPWPPPGELAGVGLFTVLLVAGLGLAICVAGRRTMVLGTTLLMISAWFMRYWFAARMWDTGAVQLYPRTTQQILYCSLLLVGFAAYFGFRRLRSSQTAALAFLRIRWAGGRRPASAVTGMLVAALALALFAGSATADRYMPRNDGSLGQLAYVSQFLRQPDGQCPAHTRVSGCGNTIGAALGQTPAPAAAPVVPVHRPFPRPQ